MMNDIFFKKKQQRKKFLLLREDLKKNKKYVFNKLLVGRLFNQLELNNFETVSSFISIKNEIPTFDLNNYIINLNKILVLPIIKPDVKILSFREFNPNENMTKGKFNIPEPNKNNKEFLPDIIVVPCLAFDDRGYRLGYGGGFYDRTFKHLEKINHKFISIGYAYEAQKTNKVIIDNFDYKLNYVLTEKQLYTF